MSNENWEDVLAEINDCDYKNEVVRFVRSCRYHLYHDPDYHREKLRRFVDASCKYGHIFTKKICKILYCALDDCYDVTIYRKLFSHGMKVYIFSGDADSYLVADSSAHMTAMVEADTENVFVKENIGVFPSYLGIRFLKQSLANTIDLTFLIEA